MQLLRTKSVWVRILYHVASRVLITDGMTRPAALLRGPYSLQTRHQTCNTCWPPAQPVG